MGTEYGVDVAEYGGRSLSGVVGRRWQIEAVWVPVPTRVKCLLDGSKLALELVVTRDRDSLPKKM